MVNPAHGHAHAEEIHHSRRRAAPRPLRGHGSNATRWSTRPSAPNAPRNSRSDDDRARCCKPGARQEGRRTRNRASAPGRHETINTAFGHAAPGPCRRRCPTKRRTEHSPGSRAPNPAMAERTGLASRRRPTVDRTRLGACRRRGRRRARQRASLPGQQVSIAKKARSRRSDVAVLLNKPGRLRQQPGGRRLRTGAGAGEGRHPVARDASGLRLQREHLRHLVPARPARHRFDRPAGADAGRPASPAADRRGTARSRKGTWCACSR